MTRSAGNPFRRLAGKLAHRLFWFGMRRFTRLGPDYVTHQLRPKSAAGVGAWPDRGGRVDGVAIAMQGPLYADDDFTVETLRLYRRQWPTARLILSTWRDTPAEQLAPIRALGVEVLLHDKPAVAGLFNLNLHIVSAGRGVARAAELGATWILKTRTDQRLYEPNALDFLLAAARAFPVRPGFDQQHRLVGVGHGTLKYALYHFTDQTVFGHARDMVRYWNPPLRTEPQPAHWPKTLPEIYHGVPVAELNRHGSAETYFAVQFLTALGRPLPWTLADTWAVWRDHFCVVDHAATGFYWAKVQGVTLRESVAHYDGVDNRRELDFAEWLRLYSGQLEPALADAHAAALSRPFGTRFDDPERSPAGVRG